MFKAMILAAGLGTRLLPLTLNQPKALVEVAGKPLIEHVLDRFRLLGIRDIVVNLHHHSGQLQAFLGSEKFKEFNITFSDESGQLLDTGGAIRKASWFFDNGQPFLVHNCDVISLVPLNELMQAHKRNRAIATLAVSDRKTSRPLAFTPNGKLIDRWNEKTSHASRPLAFSGIYVLDPAIFSFMPNVDAFSIIDVLVTAAATRPVFAFEHSPEIWVDAGNVNNLEKAEQLLENFHL
ncbi:MAG: nucleotidyltransferase family protein [Bacteroidales bacterium]|nr:nucleotidyltransferase family protein [Bacteroidales bacterium]